MTGEQTTRWPRARQPSPLRYYPRRDRSNTQRWEAWKPTKYKNTRHAPIKQDFHRTAVSKCRWNQNQLNNVPSCQDAPIVKAHTSFKIYIASPVFPDNQVNRLIGRGKTDHLSRIKKPLGKSGRTQVTQDVVNASLMPSFLESQKKDCSCLDNDKVNLSHRIHPGPPPFDLCPNSGIVHAPGTHTRGVLNGAC